MQLTEYPGALHFFDNPLFKAPTVAVKAQTTRNCVLQEGAAGQIINAQTKQVFTYDDPASNMTQRTSPDQNSWNASRGGIGLGRSRTPGREAKVTILDHFGDAVLVKLATRWIDYKEVVLIEREWKIINVL